jgi:hypothetical protein
MKNRFVSIYFSISLVLMLAGCSKDEDCAQRNDLKGEWIWVESVGGIGGWTLTPESQNVTKKLVIDDATFSEFVNDSLIFKSTYTLGISEKVLIGTTEKTYIRYESGNQQAILINGSELELIDQCYDCYFHKYRRK